MKTTINKYEIKTIGNKNVIQKVVKEQEVLKAREVLNVTIEYNNIEFSYVPPPPTRDSPGIPGQQSFDDDYHYICVSPNRWARTILTKGW